MILVSREGKTWHVDCDAHGRITTKGQTGRLYGLDRAWVHKDEEECTERVYVIVRTSSARFEVWASDHRFANGFDESEVGTRSSFALAERYARADARHKESLSTDGRGLS